MNGFHMVVDRICSPFRSAHKGQNDVSLVHVVPVDSCYVNDDDDDDDECEDDASDDHLLIHGDEQMTKKKMIVAVDEPVDLLHLFLLGLHEEMIQKVPCVTQS